MKSKIIIEKVFDDFYLLRVDDEEMEYFEAAKFSIVDVMGFKGRPDEEAGKNISRSVWSDSGYASPIEGFRKVVSFIPRLKGCKILRRNIRLGDSILDYLLECGGKALFLEVKSAVLRIGNHAVYLDCPSSRAKRQLKDIIRAVEQGHDIIHSRRSER